MSADATSPRSDLCVAEVEAHPIDTRTGVVLVPSFTADPSIALVNLLAIDRADAPSVSGQTIMLPGIGSYIATAIAERDLRAIFYAVLVMLVVILLYDQLLFRPLLAWSQKFKGDPSGDEDNS